MDLNNQLEMTMQEISRLLIHRECDRLCSPATSYIGLIHCNDFFHLSDFTAGSTQTTSHSLRVEVGNSQMSDSGIITPSTPDYAYAYAFPDGHYHGFADSTYDTNGYSYDLVEDLRGIGSWIEGCSEMIPQ